jgi:hypothetical protein
MIPATLFASTSVALPKRKKTESAARFRAEAEDGPADTAEAVAAVIDPGSDAATAEYSIIHPVLYTP